MTNWRTLLLTLPLLGCGADEPPADDSGGAAAVTGEVLMASSALDSFDARITPLVAEIPMNEPFEVTLELVDPESGEAFTDYDAVTIDARMPAHGHGMLRDVELVPQDDGSLLAEGLLFHMVGRWEIHVDVRRGARVERAQAEVILEP